MSEASLTHHKIKASWTKASKNEAFGNSSSESAKHGEEDRGIQKIEILSQIVIKPATSKSIKCHYCDKNVESSLLSEHLALHQETFFNCTHQNCDKKFRRKSSLRKHSYVHKGIFKYYCIECNIKFIDRSKYDLHKNTKHRTEDSASWKCQEKNCGKMFASSDYLKRHQVTHKDEYKYKCSFCDMKFKWMTSLQMHQTIHMQNKALVECKTCLKRFFNQRTLERHQKIHNNVKYKCMLCDKVVSNRKDNIRRHIRHLHPDFNRTEISTKIAELEGNDKGNSEDDDDGDSGTSEQADLGTDNDLEKDDSVSFIILEEPTKPPSPLPVINNRVNVIQSIGNPNKKREPSPQLPQEPHDDKIEITLPPKKKAIATIEPTTSVAAAPQPKPKYDPIEHYRKILGVSNDEPSVSIEDHHEEDETDEQEVFPIHWRKRTSQNFLFRH